MNTWRDHTNARFIAYVIPTVENPDTTTLKAVIYNCNPKATNRTIRLNVDVLQIPNNQCGCLEFTIANGSTTGTDGTTEDLILQFYSDTNQQYGIAYLYATFN